MTGRVRVLLIASRRVALAAAAMAGGTMAAGWWTVGLVGLVVGALARPGWWPALEAALAGALAWSGLMGWGWIEGPVWTVAVRVAGAMQLAPFLLLAATVIFPAVLAGSAAAIGSALGGGGAPRRRPVVLALAVLALGLAALLRMPGSGRGGEPSPGARRERREGQAPEAGVRKVRSSRSVAAAPVRSDSSVLLPAGPVGRTARCVVARVVDGDTFTCRGGVRVRLIGVDAPELSQRPYGGLARAALARWLPAGSEVLLERDVEPVDRYGRWLAYVWRGRILVNWELVRGGWAVLLTVPPNVRHVEALVEAQRRAREAKAGLWAEGGFDCLPAERRRGRCE